MQIGVTVRHPTSPSLLPLVQFDSGQFPAGQGFDSFKMFLPAYEPSSAKAPSAWAGRATAWRLGQLVLTHNRLDAIHLFRPEPKIRADGVDYYSVFMMTEGQWGGDFDGRQVEAQPGEACLIDLARPISAGTVAPSRTVALNIPREVLDEVLPPFDMHGRLLNAGPGGLFCDHLRALVSRIPELTEHEAVAVARATLDLLAGCLAPMRPEANPAPAAISVLTRARRHISRNLGGDLSSGAMSKALSVSRSSLYRAFEPLGGVAVYVQRRRLARAHRLLSRPGEHRTSSEIAHALGFPSSTHFGRQFRREYGYAPGELRTAVARAAPPSDLMEPPDPSETYGRWLRGVP